MKKRLASAILAVIMLLSFAAGSFSLSAEEGFRGQAGSDVSGFASATIGGAPIDGSVFAGYRISIVTYWATWNAASLQQLDYLNGIRAARPEIGVFGILYEDSTSTADAAKAYMQAHGYDFEVFTADAVWQGVISQLAFLPQSYFVSPSGIILEAVPGAFSSAEAMLGEALQWVSEAGTYTVRFYDRFDGTNVLLASYTVAYGASAEPPVCPEHEGYEFKGWSGDGYLFVTGDTEVFALYERIISRPDGDVDGSGVFDNLDPLMLMRALLGLVPVSDEMLAHGDMDMNGVLDSRDALIMMRILLGLID